MLEISSLKVVEHQGLRLNSFNAANYARAAGVDARAFLSGHEVDWPAAHQLLRGATARNASPAELRSDIEWIVAKTSAPVVLVDHLDALTAAGDPIPGRRELSKVLEDISNQLGLVFYSTRPTLEAHGRDVALKDAAHYHADFENVVASDLEHALQRAINTEQPTARRASLMITRLRGKVAGMRR